jgi:hypothetical protein
VTVARRLEDELFAVGGEVCFIVIAAERQLPDVAQVLIRRQRELLWRLRKKQ